MAFVNEDMTLKEKVPVLTGNLNYWMNPRLFFMRL